MTVAVDLYTPERVLSAMIKILLSALLPFLLSCGRSRMSAYGQKSCNPLSGQFSLCQCEMSDGSGVPYSAKFWRG